MLPVVSYRGTRVAYMADLTPAAAHLPMAWVIGYDTRPLLTMEEKALLLDQAHREDWMLFFEHDAMKAPRKEFEPPASLPALKKLGADPVQRAINPLLMRLTSAGPS